MSTALWRRAAAVSPRHPAKARWCQQRHERIFRIGHRCRRVLVVLVVVVVVLVVVVLVVVAQ